MLQIEFMEDLRIKTEFSQMYIEMEILLLMEQLKEEIGIRLKI